MAGKEIAVKKYVVRLSAEERDQLNQLREEVRLGLEQLDHGRHRPFDDQAVNCIKRQGRERVAAAQHKGRAG